LKKVPVEKVPKDLSYRTGPAAQAATAGPSGHLEGFLSLSNQSVNTFEIEI
jgi:hypothetical protein